MDSQSVGTGGKPQSQSKAWEIKLWFVEEHGMDTKIVDKIRKLLALGESPSEAEAQSAYAKAHELLRLYNLELSDITASVQSAVQGEVVDEGAHELLYERVLMGVIATANYCAFVIIKGRVPGAGKASYQYKLFGREANIATTMVMFEYLRGVVRRLADVALRSMEVEHFVKKDFRIAMIRRLQERMEEQAIAEAQNSGGTALVVVSTEARDAMRAAHPHLRYSNVRSNDMSASASMGRRMADSVSLNRQVDGARSSTQRRIGQ